MSGRYWWSILVLLAVALTPACVDSEISGFPGDVYSADGPGLDFWSFDIWLVDPGSDPDLPGPDPGYPDVGCTSNEECQDVFGPLNACQQALCDLEQGSCVLDTKPGCCLTDADCPSTDCLLGTCPTPGGTCQQVDICDCEDDQDCQELAPPCQIGTCNEGACSFEPTDACCTTAEECQDGSACTAKQCLDGQCAFPSVNAPGCCAAEPLLHTSFMPAPNYYSIQSSATVGWNVVTTGLTPSPPNALYLGNPDTMLYLGEDTPVTASARFSLGYVEAGAGIEVAFQVWYDVRQGQGKDKLRVTLESSTGAQAEVYRKGDGPYEEWHSVSQTHSFATAGDVTLKFWFGQVSGNPDEGTVGVLVDDLTVKVPCSSCSSDAQCSSDDPCLAGACVGGQCEYKPLPGCCATVADCEASTDVCSQPACVANVCQVVPIPDCCYNKWDCYDDEPVGPCDDWQCLNHQCIHGTLPDCCVTAADCPWGDPCVEWTCWNQQCLPNPVAACCQTQSDCDDGNPCTIDSCVGQQCQHVIDPECSSTCTPQVYQQSFDGGDAGWTFTATDPEVGWHITSTPFSHSPPGVLYYGDPAVLNFETPGSINQGTATSPLLTIPGTATQVTLNFWAYLEVELFFQYDRLELYVVPSNGPEALVWEKPSDVSMDTWFPVSVPLDGWLGQVIQLRFAFDTVDSVANDGKGVFIDDFNVLAVCDGPICQTAGDCPPGGPCTYPECIDGSCEYQPIIGCCDDDSDCNDGDDCTLDTCFAQTGTCGHQQIPGCCTIDGDCEDYDPCTINVCDSGQCLFIPVPGICCSSDGDCYDGQVCTLDICNLDTGQCTNLPVPSCCTNDFMCNDSVVCTQDGCDLETGQCYHKPIPACCTSPMDCWDNNDCTEDICTPTGECYYLPLPGCCVTHADCDDGSACTEDFCDESSGECFYFPLADCCEADWQCADDDPCTLDVCQLATGSCLNQPLEGCCTSDFQCEDFILCTADYCDLATNQCGHDPIPGCCDNDAMCASPDPCVNGWCNVFTGTCQFDPLPGCCLNPEDCFDANPCTLDICITPFCQWQPIPDCCTSDLDCLSDDPCTYGWCDIASGQCQYKTLTNCCTGPWDCDDGNPCTIDSCDSDTGECSNQQISGCCVTAADCDDGNKCTIDSCVGGECQHQIDINCCTTDPDCDDGNPCTMDICFTVGPFGICQYQPLPGPTCCISDNDCLGPVCTIGTCTQFLCEFEPDPDCCTSTGECDDGNPCTNDTCGPDGKCEYAKIPNCCTKDWDCDDGDFCTDEWCNLLTNSCEYVQIPGCCISDDQCDDGDPCTWDICEPGIGCMWLPNPDCCGSAGECNDGDPCTNDSCVDGQCFYTPVICPDDGNPCTMEICEPFMGGCTSIPLPDCCEDASQCFDFDPCTEDLCLPGGMCANPPIPGCCTADWQCNDNDACTADVCGMDNQCDYLPVPDCCKTAADCNDADPCTTDSCSNGTCVHTTVPNCCYSDGDCNDGNVCSVDQCVPSSAGGPGVCQYSAANAPGCCADVSDCPLQVCTFVDCSAWTCQYKPDPTCCTTPADCNDGNPCTNDSCVGGSCVNMPIPDCCIDDGDCNDGDPCTMDMCSDASTCIYLPIGPGECITAADCDDGDACTVETCEECGVCSSSILNCNDGDACTIDFCDPDAGCLNQLKSCDDGDPCTSDSCNPNTGQCVHTPNGTCCTSAADCNDNDVCTTDACVGGNCEYSDVPGCCNDAGDCDDFNFCTWDSCVSNSCQHEYDIFCCQTDPECDDGNPCTQDTCVVFMEYGVCQYMPIPGPTCCINPDDCTPQTCKIADCVNYECEYTDDPGCACDPADCNDGDPCTIDDCGPAGECIYTPNPACCQSDAECNDGNDCTADSCDQASGKCIYTPVPNCCQSNGDCNDGNMCTTDVCEPSSGTCSWLPNPGPPGCCAAASDCDDGDDCTTDTCTPGTWKCSNKPIPNCCVDVEAATFNFENGSLNGWTITPAQAPGQVTWWISNTRSVSPMNSLYMGNPETGNFDIPGQTPTALARTPSIQLPDTPYSLVEFRIWIDTEPGNYYDNLQFSVVPASGAPVMLWDKGGIDYDQHQTWVTVKANLSGWAGQTVQLQWYFDAGDHIANDGEGIYIDNVRVQGFCEDPGFCNSAAECNDGNPCTVDACLSNVCSHTTQPDCCLGDAECNDNYACTQDSCVDNECVNVVMPNCCVYDDECNDGVPCTADSCNTATNKCSFVPGPGCCTGDDDCDDGDPCTNDACNNYSCVHGPTTDPGCCVVDTWFLATFPSQADYETFAVIGDGSDVHWQPYSGRWASPPFAFYFGDPLFENYDTGEQVEGQALSDQIPIPASAQGPRLSFNIYLDIENEPFRDHFTVSLLVGGNSYQVWSKTQIPWNQYQQWHSVDIDLPTALSGKSPRIYLDFDSVDAWENWGEGIYIDDIQLHNVCPAP